MKPTTTAKLKEPQNRDHFNKQLELVIEELTLQADSRERVKEYLADLKEKFEISPVIVRKLAKAKLEDKLDELLAANSELVSLTSVIE